MQKIFIFLSLSLFVACGTESSPSNSLANDATVVSVAEARRLYTMKCGLCHGADGKLMVAGAPDLSKSRLSLDDRIALITYGKGAMPPQRGILSSAEIRAVATYIEDFRD